MLIIIKLLHGATSLMCCWLLWQPVAVFAYCLRFIVFCSMHGDKNKY